MMIMKNYIMKSFGLLTTVIILLFAAQGCYSQNTSSQKKSTMDSSNNKKNPVYSNTDTTKIVLTDDEWKKMLSPEVFNVARQKGTERPYTSQYEAFKEVGTYYCAVCGNALFKSDTKFESGCGWPSFYQPISKGSIIYAQDNTYGMSRTEVMCGRCKSHLGHVFYDGPPPTGLRYCINGVVLDFKKAQEIEKNYNAQEKNSNN
jgi:peptide-methionine (R)-S-oxide reductase